ncbi:hypothetical protein DS884_02540 [Tenacibaculum sp. E3R01]|uniref:FEKKY domain-containing protein n=1 Tax=Tenacibaculum sp. E3R01 TaxID=2267227 RepID=UPI000DEBD268|nr:hypothetical protein [Tenacibaculum sp. E3R01]RBW62498.1 hypothetical protein DS884_02540 [Tenacibaculum sp. E3R01]
MKIKLLITFILFAFLKVENTNSQNDTIRGKLFFSNAFYNKFSLILVKEKSTKIPVVLNENGEFELIPNENKKNYDLVFIYKNDTLRKFKFKKEWTKRKGYKSISLNEKCDASKKTALADLKNNKVKIFLFSRNQNERKIAENEKKLEERYNFKYIYLKNINQFDCYLEYNRKILKILPLKMGREFLNELNENVIGWK